MKDIAKQCNVSVASVSKALNGYSDISEESRQLILKTAWVVHYPYSCSLSQSKIIFIDILS